MDSLRKHDAIAAPLRQALVAGLELHLPACGPWQPLCALADGGMGTVSIATDHERLAIVKQRKILNDSNQDRRLRARFEREAQLLLELDNPHIISSFGYQCQQDQQWLALEYLDQGDLRDLLAHYGALPPAVALATFEQIAHGLAAVHQLGLVHRDLKPANIFYDQDGRVLLADFGIARINDPEVTQLTMAGMVVGSPLFMSPEQARGHDQHLLPSTDIYAAGHVLYTLLTGEAPFQYLGNQERIINAHLAGAIPDIRRLRPDLPPEINDFIQACCQTQPDKRPTHGQDFVNLVQSLRQQTDKAASELTPQTVISRFLKRTPIDQHHSAPAEQGATTILETSKISGMALSPFSNSLPDSPLHWQSPQADLVPSNAIRTPWLVLSANEGRVFLWALNQLTLGSQRGKPVDCCLRRYPLADEQALSKRISRHHLSIVHNPDSVTISDPGSRNGSRIDGVKLMGQIALRANQRYEIDLAGALQCEIFLPPLIGQIEHNQAMPVHASGLVMRRLNNHQQHCYAMCWQSLTVGSKGNDIPLEYAQERHSISICWAQDCWWWREDENWHILTENQVITIAGIQHQAVSGEYSYFSE